MNRYQLVEIEPRKRQIARADHQRHDEIAERVGDRRDQEEPHHHHAVDGEQPIVDVGGDQIALRRGELQPDDRRRRAADEEEQRDAGEIKHGDALVVGGEEPGAQAVVLGEIIARRRSSRRLRRIGQRLDVGDDPDELVLGDLAFIGRHQRLITRGDLAARLEDRIADIALVGDLDRCRRSSGTGLP